MSNLYLPYYKQFYLWVEVSEGWNFKALNLEEKRERIELKMERNDFKGSLFTHLFNPEQSCSMVVEANSHFRPEMKTDNLVMKR